MKNLLALLILVAMAPVAEAGPIRDRLRARFAPRPVCVPASPVARPVVVAPRVNPAPSAGVSVVRYAVPVTAACPTGQCPLKR